MEFGVLGPLEVRCGGDPLVVSSRMERLLLAALLVDANGVVSTARLIDLLWGTDPPPSARNSLQSYVTRLRQRLAGQFVPGPILTRPPGYLIEVDPRQLDAQRFEQLLAEAGPLRAECPSRALALLDQALALWRGPAYSEFADEEVARGEAARLDELREVATEDRVEALLVLGRTNEAIADLEGIIAGQSLRERPHAQLMRALSRAGRQVEALDRARAYRDRLRELGLQPSVALRELETDILREAPTVAPQPHGTPVFSRPGNLPAHATSFVGREHELAELRAALDTGRIITLVGPGGVGKTRLALRLAAQVGNGYPDGVWVAELASVSTADAVTQSF